MLLSYSTLRDFSCPLRFVFSRQNSNINKIKSFIGVIVHNLYYRALSNRKTSFEFFDKEYLHNMIMDWEHPPINLTELFYAVKKHLHSEFLQNLECYFDSKIELETVFGICIEDLISVVEANSWLFIKPDILITTDDEIIIYDIKTSKTMSPDINQLYFYLWVVGKFKEVKSSTKTRGYIYNTFFNSVKPLIFSNFNNIECIIKRRCASIHKVYSSVDIKHILYVPSMIHEKLMSLRSNDSISLNNLVKNLPFNTCETCYYRYLCPVNRNPKDFDIFEFPIDEKVIHVKAYNINYTERYLGIELSGRN